ncbi:hypothetical protein [Pseudonocardia sp.]|jgi:hypothetical protein|uniref:hypothetical protein n=1 Tax=Pseudonocardia sp. TaxID=60912 RepID=UPI00262CDD72|nr:hypothetical protein [Pseudonocardia sp.]MCW2719931.1 hypothetical protein [Pseudonocardia sp.]MDT7613284.1 hypothetical protein [Pseudonocardiales bacterium]
MAAPRTATLPPATPISWEAQAPTGRTPVLADGLPAAAPFGTGPFAAGPVTPAAAATLDGPGPTLARSLVGAIAGVLAMLLLLAVVGGLLQLTGAVPA